MSELFEELKSALYGEDKAREIIHRCPNEGNPCYCTGACRGEVQHNSGWSREIKQVVTDVTHKYLEDE